MTARLVRPALVIGAVLGVVVTFRDPAWIVAWATAGALVAWALVVGLSLRIIRTDIAPPSAMRRTTLATLVVVAGCLTVSALVYPDVITSDASRLFVNMGRAVLLIGGWVAVWQLRRVRR